MHLIHLLLIEREKETSPTCTKILEINHVMTNKKKEKRMALFILRTRGPCSIQPNHSLSFVFDNPINFICLCIMRLDGTERYFVQCNKVRIRSKVT